MSVLRARFTVPGKRALRYAAAARCGRTRQVVAVDQVHASWASDELGPAPVAFLRPCAGVEAVVVVDNVALGPTVKNALAGLPHGGGKADIAAPGLEAAGHERVMRAFARAIRQLTDYIPGPDMG